MIPQYKYYLGAALIAPFLPYLLWRGKQLKDAMPDLPPARDPKGLVGPNGKPIRLLALGESTIAGTGVATHAEGLAGQLAQRLAELVKRPIAWEVIGKSGYTAKMVREKLVPQMGPEKLDIVLIGLGGNDTFKLNRPRRWREEFIELIQTVRQKQPDSKIVIANLPPVGTFPAFPKVFTTILGNLVRLHATAIADLPQHFREVYFNNREIFLEEWMEELNYPTQPEDFFSDGVHPSALTYQLWGYELAEFIWEQVGASLRINENA